MKGSKFFLEVGVNGLPYRRAGWNDPTQFVFLAKPNMPVAFDVRGNVSRTVLSIDASFYLAKNFYGGAEPTISDYQICPWTATNDDLYAEDWEIADIYRPFGFTAFAPLGYHLPFGIVLNELERGKKAYRSDWAGKDMFIYLVPGSQFKVSRAPLLGIFEEGHDISYRQHIDLSIKGKLAAVYSPPARDLTSLNWFVVEEDGQHTSLREIVLP